MTAEDIITSSNQGPVNQPVEGGPPVPGAWYFEIGSDDGSPNSALSMNSRNVTESVEVPSSEHVAEIVGRQGCKIKVLRAKTNTYIKTPVRGEDPIFVVTGRPEDVADAKREIECAAEHFTQIRASRRHSQGGAPAPGHITAYVRVPLRVVGLVVGPKGATIKRIQQDTHTYIITPSREREPIFEVTGLPQNVEAARREIEQHIYQRTGNMPITDTSASIEAYDLQVTFYVILNVLNYDVIRRYGNYVKGSLASAASHRTSNVSYGALAQSVRRPSAIDALQNNYDLLKNSPDMAFNLVSLVVLFRVVGIK
uniref:KH domain-containing protein n=1 Tax=Syphacia muris TaxID=451379 RepID=A0A0N5A9K3_9BILA